jgi:hypothetical protein
MQKIIDANIKTYKLANKSSHTLLRAYTHTRKYTHSFIRVFANVITHDSYHDINLRLFPNRTSSTFTLESW